MEKDTEVRELGAWKAMVRSLGCICSMKGNQ